MGIKIKDKTFSGKSLLKPNGGLDAYIPDKALVQAINLSIFLRRPLLLTGDPGCGKTRLAEAVAFEWYNTDYIKYLYRWDIKSTSKAKEGLYSFDNLRKLYDIQSTIGRDSTKSNNAGLKDDKEYRTLGKLGLAFLNSTKDRPCILLIDEIDKAPIDFPNDLLLELDEMKFSIPESDETIVAKFPPVVIITSNSEKELPAAFLRRCIYHHIEFPDKGLLEMILTVNKEINNDLIKSGLKLFIDIRTQQESQNLAGEKLVSTSEMIDWFKFLTYAMNNQSDYEKVMKQLENNQIPYFQALLKKMEDLQHFKNKTVIAPDVQ